MKKIVLLRTPIKNVMGTAMWQCPVCGTISPTFRPDGDGGAECGECGEKVNFKTWKNYTAYEGIAI